MTDIQLPLHHQTHQKGMNGKYSAKNLEIRGISGNNSASQPDSKLTSSSTLSTTSKRSLKLIDTKAQASNQNFQVLRLNNNEISSFTVFDTNTATTPAMNHSSLRATRRNNNRNSIVSSCPDDENLSNFTSNSSNNLMQKHQASNQGQTFSTNYKSSYVVSRSNTINSASNWNEESNSGWTGTGVMSDRSSVYSIDDGDFDREASRKVNNQLREIESILYEQNSGHSSKSMSECKEWLEKFPHIRILGKQLLNSRSEIDSQLSLDNLRNSLKMLTSTAGSISSKSDSFKTEPVTNTSINTNSTSVDLPTETTSPETVPSFSNYKYFRRRETSDINNQNLNLFGTHLPIRHLDASVYEQRKPGDDFSSFEEEVFEEEGVYEELFAYDNQEEEHLFEQNKRLNLSKRRRHGLPPITPKAAMKDLVLHFLFDHMWSELIDWISELIKTYARTLTHGSFEPETCKTPLNNLSFNSGSNLNMEKIIFTKSKTDLLPSISPTYTGSSSLLVSETNSSLNLPSSTSVTKANIIQLKLFDQMLEQKQAQSLLSRENSVMYPQPSRLSNEANTDIVGDLLTKDLLQIKQLNRNGMSNNTISSSKALNPIIAPQMRVGSGTRRQYTNNYYRKRYSSIEMSSNMGGIDKNIIIHGAGLVKPPSLLQITDMDSKTSGTTNNSAATSNSLVPFANITSGNNATNLAIFSANTRNANSSIQAYSSGFQNDENIYENDDNDYHSFQNHIIDENAIDEINLLSQNFNRNYYHNNISSGNNNNGHYSHVYNYFGHHTNHSAGYKSLPPIENSLTSKPIRISSANNMKQTKEKNERPMTSTSTRFDLTGPISMNRRSTTPMGTVNKGIASKKINFSKPEDSIYANNSFLSTKAFNNSNNVNSSSINNNFNANIGNSINNNTPNTNGNSVNPQLQNRRNSFTRVFR